jgi:hypothetical protein
MVTFGLLNSLSSSKLYLLLCTVFYFWAIYRAENFPLKDKQLVLFPFCQHPRFAAVQQDREDQGLVDR